MDQLDPNSQGNEAQPHWDRGPIRTNDGYEGSNENFRVMVNVIKIKKTDAVNDHLPSEEQRQFSVDNEGTFSQYEQQAVGSETYQLWMRKIGPYLADWVLRLPRRGAFFLPLFLLRPQAFYFVLTTWAMIDVLRLRVSREPPLEALEIPGQLHALDPQEGHNNRPPQPAHRCLSVRRTAPGSPHGALPNGRRGDLPLADGVRPARHMAHEGRHRPMRLQILHPRSAPERNQSAFEPWCRRRLV